MKYYRATEVAKNLYVTSATVYRWILDGKLECLNAGSKKIVSDEGLRKFLDKHDDYKSIWYPERTLELNGKGYLVYIWGTDVRKTIVNVLKTKKFANVMEIFERALEILNADRAKQGLGKLCFEEVNFKPLGNPGDVDILEG